MIPKGKLLIIGGAEDRGMLRGSGPIVKENFRHFEILAELLPPGGSKQHIIEIITSASEIPEELIADYKKVFRRIGFQHIHHMNIKTKDEARNNIYVKRIEKAHAVLFGGGDQFRLSTILGGTELIEVIDRKYKEDKDFIIAGTSSGAMVMPQVMIASGESDTALLKGEVKIAAGFGFIENCIIDSHFLQRSRFGRLTHAILMSPACTGIGICENTAIIIKNGNEAECRGSGMVTIIDGKNIRHTNIAYTEDKEPVNVENLKVHILCNGDGYFIKERQFIISKKDRRFEKNIH